MKYTVFDVETPNYANNRMSAVGITVMEDDTITDTAYYLVDPETRFDAFNIQLTGITPEMVRGEKTFGTLWKEIEPYFADSVLVAHNAPFDMSVLAKCLRAYGISWKPQVPYACTCAIGRRCLPGLPNHKLNTMCESLSIPLMHHHAGSDSTAAACLLQYYLRRGVPMRQYIKAYDMERICTRKEINGGGR